MRFCPKHGAGTEKGKEYIVVDIAYWFHNWPHMKFTFRPIENTMFNYGETEYERSIIFWAVISLFVCLIIIVVYMIFSLSFYFFTGRTKKSENSKEDKEKADKAKEVRSSEPTVKRTGISKCWKITLILMAIMCAFSLAGGFYGVWRIYVGLGSLHNATQDGVQWFKAIKSNLAEVDPLKANNFKRLVQNLKEEIDSFNLMPNVMKNFTILFDRIVGYVDSINDNVIKTNIPLYNISRIDVEWIYEDIESYGNLICIILVVIVLLIGIVGLLFSCGVFHIYVLAVFTLIAIVAIILNSFLMSIALSATIFISDFCADAKPFIKDQLNEWLLYQYLVECPLNNNPVGVVVEKASDLVFKITDSFNKLFKGIETLLNLYCKTSSKALNLGIKIINIVPLINLKNLSNTTTCPFNIQKRVGKTVSDIESQLTMHTQLFETFKMLADCRRINKDLYDALNSICGDINPGIVVVYFNSTFSLVCLLLIVFCVTIAMIMSGLKLHKKSRKRFPNKKKNKK